jgi:hypothetical protein
MNMYIPCIFINYKLAAFSPITSSIFAHRPYDRTLFSRFCRASKDHLSVHDHSLPRDRSTIVSSLAEIYALMKLGDACPPGDVFQRKQRARERERERERERSSGSRSRQIIAGIARRRSCAQCIEIRLPFAAHRVHFMLYPGQSPTRSTSGLAKVPAL